MIPISLYVVIEMLKLAQAKQIGADVKMYCLEDGNWGVCRNSDLIEELGQVEFVFSDKTGTLTQNKMEYKKSSINGSIYGMIQPGEEPNEGMCQSSVDLIQKSIRDYETNGKTKSPTAMQGFYLHEFYNLLAVCHTVVCDVNPKTGMMMYQASSPDELALSNGAK